MSIPLRLLVVEDSEDDTSLLLRELGRGGYEVNWKRIQTPGKMKEALATQTWDLVICDYSMPQFSGSDALRILRETGLDIPFIFLSGRIGEDYAVAAMKQGAQDYVMKGNMKRLLPAIERELKEAERRKERVQLERRVKHLERFEAIGKLAGGIAHDFNNVIGVILGSAQLGETQAPEQSLVRERFRTIRSQAELASGLTRQLLAFARRQVLRPETVDLNETVLRIQDLLRSGLGEGIELKTDLSLDIEAIKADPSQIEQVLMNLVLNAKDAMPKGGTLAIETTQVDLSDEFCRLHSYGRPGSYVMLTISDTGLGMDAATQEHIFEPFFTTKELGKGTGLGLATVYGVIKQHGGFINVYSEPGQGTTFRLYLPAAGGRAQAKQTEVASRPAAGSETILVAEDNAPLRALAVEVLTSQGYKVIVANDGQEAVRLFRENSDTIDLVFVDIVMPKLSGPKAFLEMSAFKRNVRVLFASGHAAETATLTSSLPPDASFLQKPYSPQALSEAVRAVIDQK